MIGPIRPSDVVELKRKNIPQEVFEAFNELITEKLSSGRATISQSDVVDRILVKMTGAKRAAIFANGWLDIEPPYTAAGWIVSYDKPGYNESGAAVFTFVCRA